MKIIATKSFSGVVSMRAGEVKDVASPVAKDLIEAGYAITPPKKRKGKK